MQLRCYEKTLIFSIFRLKSKTVIRKFKPINKACIWTPEHIIIKSVRSFEELTVRKNLKKLFAKVQN